MLWMMNTCSFFLMALIGPFACDCSRQSQQHHQRFYRRRSCPFTEGNICCDCLQMLKACCPFGPHLIIIMEICKALTLRLKALHKPKITHIIYIKMENVISNLTKKLTHNVDIKKGSSITVKDACTHARTHAHTHTL